MKLKTYLWNIICVTVLTSVTSLIVYEHSLQAQQLLKSFVSLFYLKWKRYLGSKITHLQNLLSSGLVLACSSVFVFFRVPDHLTFVFALVLIPESFTDTGFNYSKSHRRPLYFFICIFVLYARLFFYRYRRKIAYLKPCLIFCLKRPQIPYL